MKKVLAAGIALGLVLAGLFTHRYEVYNYFKPNCAQTVINQQTAPAERVTSITAFGQTVTAKGGATLVVPKVYKGSFECMNADFKYVVGALYGVTNDTEFSLLIWLGPTAHQEFKGETADGGLVYEVHTATNPHNEFGGVYDDISNGAWGSIWPELTGQTQGYTSAVETIYLVNGIVDKVQ